MGVEVDSVNSHRHNIRKKLDIIGTDEQLSSWLKKRLENYLSPNGV